MPPNLRQQSRLNSVCLSSVALLVLLLLCGPARGDSGAFTPELRAGAMDYIAQSLQHTLATLGDSFPVATDKGVWYKDNGGWTGGYWAGMLWLMYQTASGWVLPGATPSSSSTTGTIPARSTSVSCSGPRWTWAMP